MPRVTQHDRGRVEVRRPRGSPSQWQVASQPMTMFTKPPETQTKTMSKHLFLDSPNKCDDPSCTLAPTSALVTLGTRSFFVGGCPVHWRMVSNISGWMPGAPVWFDKCKCLCLPDVPWGARGPTHPG